MNFGSASALHIQTDRKLRVGIVGGGFTGAVLAAHLLRGLAKGIDVSLVERGPVVGPGLAYSTQNPKHILNVRVANMSAFDDDPAHFLKWLWAKDTEGAVSAPPSGQGSVYVGPNPARRLRTLEALLIVLNRHLF